MIESAALLVDEVLPHQPMRQWVLSVSFPLRFLFANQPKIMGKALGSLLLPGRVESWRGSSLGPTLSVSGVSRVVSWSTESFGSPSGP
jgi:hypothetical protein